MTVVGRLVSACADAQGDRNPPGERQSREIMVVATQNWPSEVITLYDPKTGAKVWSAE